MSTARLPLYSAGLMLAVAAVLAGCSSSGSSVGGAGTGSASSPAASTPQEVMKLAANTASGASSFTGTMSLRTIPKPGTPAASGAAAGQSLSMSATLAERLHPSVLVSANFGTLSAGAQSLPGGLAEIITPSTLYVKAGFLTSKLHLSKPWLAVPLSVAGKKSGINFGQLFSQLQSNSPLTDTQLLAAATSVRRVGTGTIGGAPVTEYTGTLPLAKGLSHLPGRLRAQARQALAAAGITTATFTVWIDGQHLVRKCVLTESGKFVTEVTTVTVTSINQPVNIAIPPASQTTSMPSAALKSGSGI